MQWAIAIVLAPAGAITYLLTQNAHSMAFGAACVIPLFLLAHERDERLADEPRPYVDGPWGLP